jgi:hypothetical protein
MINFLASRDRHPRGIGGADFRSFLDDQATPSRQDSALFELEYRRQLFHWASERIRDEFQPTTWAAFWRTWVEGGSRRTWPPSWG